MKTQTVRLLLIEEDLDDLCLFNELVTEIREEHLHRARIPDCDLLHAMDLAEAEEILDRAPVDLILLDAAISCGGATEALAALRSRHPDVPAVVLTDEHLIGDETQMIRLGAQDVLWKRDVDCLPLLRAVLFGIERHKCSSALRAITYMDELTGLYNRQGFLEIAHHVLALARRSRQPCSLVAVAPSCPPGDGDTDLMLIEIADLLRAATDATQVVARDSAGTFLVLTPACPADFVERFSAHMREQVYALNQRRIPGQSALGVSCGVSHAASPPPLDEWIEVVERALCENGRHAAEVRQP
jgi:two-component system, cell cycle response regulator